MPFRLLYSFAFLLAVVTAPLSAQVRAVPANVSATAISSTQVALTWNYGFESWPIPASQSPFIQIYDNVSGVLGNLDSSFTSTTISGLTPGWSYVFSVSVIYPDFKRSASSNLVTLPGGNPPPVSPPAGAQWHALPGKGVGIAVGANGTAWILGTDRVGAGFQPYYWNGSNWVGVSGGLRLIATGPDGTLWGINYNNSIFSRFGGQYQLYPGAGMGIAVGANGQAWILGTNKVSAYDYQPYFWNGTSWIGIDGGLTQIAVDPAGNPWGINGLGVIFRRVNNQWQRLPGLGRQIAIGAGGHAWILGTNVAGKGYQPYYWNGGAWVGVSGALSTLAVGPDGSLWGINTDGTIFHRY